MPDGDLPSTVGAPVDRTADLELLVAAAREAGRIALGFFRNDPRQWTKGEDSPVTEADIASDRYLHATLTGARPDYGWLSEETADTADRLGRRRVFVVDPIDGTRGFIEGSHDWCVSVAIVEDGFPVAGALAVPAREEYYQAVLGGGAWLNGARIHVGAHLSVEGARVAGPIRHLRAFASAGLTVAERLYTPSLAYRLAMVAADRLDLATARPHAHDWDLAAVDLLVHEAGGILRDLDGARLRYNRLDPRHPVLIAATPRLADAVAPLIAAAEAKAMSASGSAP
ncbi:3'(2'),5'-bisphosphate nucleotidase CysQ [Kaistia dalseonensis]|uniref:Myo-inositol-1(Or 4)-monophosphatase n=1 Tax=Kaistia dalseonensis TaxID=410840 RepID=A0ABU0HCF9_9HYPH|nr:3'(2'),5'-bisphosphate nucleotidase CysQ [Kaistia dalseonensis]MCX5497362.1 3'(2'),5'-bisphosphate nucleotidase CysQ [Kaistia dalseonensis]MDQ0440000.1 myo-inositol-1(or 4)-monophosphatase [Kaistia dalseonensis]